VFSCCKLQVFYLDVAHVTYATNVSDVASVCSKCFICFPTYVASVLIWMLHMFSHIRCNSMFQIVSSVSVLQQVFSCCKLQVFFSRCCICFRIYVASVYSVSDICYIQVFYVARVSCSSESQGRRRMGCGEPVVGERGVRHTGGSTVGA
jgi:hypothetical protein